MRARRRLVGVLLVAGAGLILLGLIQILDRDRFRIEAERLRRHAYAAAGVRLPGTPALGELEKRLAAQGLELGAPVFIRIFKLEFELEVWMKRGDRFERFAVYPICRWSGLLGPKVAEGDWQAPEGFYTVDAKALNPASRWHRSFNLGFPNAFDRTHGRTGSYLMVHGGCSSIGCYAMTDAVIDEIWRLVTAALQRGQPRFHVHIFPFRMTDERLADRSGRPWAAFWHDLKPGYDAFEATGLPPRVSVCQGRYAVSPDQPGTAGSSPIEPACPNATGAKT
ncbi:MAG TPA: murein L,D-transpeptidase family protein [Hyphomicrobiaceae bacterium]